MKANDLALSARALSLHFQSERGDIRALERANLDLPRGKILAIVGESGCGKSSFCRSVMRLHPEPPAKYIGGELMFYPMDSEPLNILSLKKNELRALRGEKIAMIFQDPLSSLNPFINIGDQVAEVFVRKQALSWREARRRALHALEEAQIPAASRRMRQYPHQFSGGMRQRVLIAGALASEPEILLADEPSSALDAKVQVEILALIKDLQKKKGAAVILVTHDLAQAIAFADIIAVMYAGKIVEYAPAELISTKPMHDYTRALLASRPSANKRGRRLREIKGAPPKLDKPLPGYAFALRHGAPHWHVDICQNACEIETLVCGKGETRWYEKRPPSLDKYFVKN